MANDYISRADLMALVESEYWKYRDEYRATEILEDIEKFPAADVRPVERGRWIGAHNELQCSVCGKRWDDLRTFTADDNGYWIEFPPFCPNCGADMTGGADG